MFIKKKFPSADMKAVASGDYTDHEVIHKGDWIDDGKYSHQDIVFKSKDDGKFYMVSHGRSGSYFTDYYYDWEDWGDTVECCEVEERSVTKTSWVCVEGGAK